MVSECEDNALALVRSAQTGTLRAVLCGASVHEYLGDGWLGVHYKTNELADALQALVNQDAA